MRCDRKSATNYLLYTLAKLASLQQSREISPRHSWRPPYQTKLSVNKDGTCGLMKWQSMNCATCTLTFRTRSFRLAVQTLASADLRPTSASSPFLRTSASSTITSKRIVNYIQYQDYSLRSVYSLSNSLTEAMTGDPSSKTWWKPLFRRSGKGSPRSKTQDGSLQQGAITSSAMLS
jgi:hypothetical protein